jgi:tryptophan-rich sensory protein
MLGLDRRDLTGALANALLPLGVVLAANALIFTFGWGAADPPYLSLSFAPPGWLVAAAWSVIFVLWGLARWSVRGAGEGGREASWLVVVLIGSALLYPIRTANFDLRLSAVQNAATLAFVVFVTWRLGTHSRRAAWFMAPSIAWVAFANVLGLAALTNRGA